MERITRAAGGVYTVSEESVRKCSEGWAGDAVEKLAKFENMLEKLLKERDDTAAELESLRKEGREKSVTFKQLLARKLLNGNILVMLESHGIRTSFRPPYVSER
jgi:hypothetical protein